MRRAHQGMVLLACLRNRKAGGRPSTWDGEVRRLGLRMPPPGGHELISRAHERKWAGSIPAGGFEE